MSREAFPKQLLPLTSERSLLQDTAGRIADTAIFAPPIVVCNAEHRFVIAEQMRNVGVEPEAIVLEPAAKNTAPAVISPEVVPKSASSGRLTGAKHRFIQENLGLVVNIAKRYHVEQMPLADLLDAMRP